MGIDQSQNICPFHIAVHFSKLAPEGKENSTALLRSLVVVEILDFVPNLGQRPGQEV